MPELTPFLKQIISLPGLSGHERPVREAIAEAWKPLVDELAVSRLGSLHGLRRGVGDEPRRRLMLAAHADAIGLMVTGIAAGGFLRFTRVGGVDARILPAQRVTVHGRSDLAGVVVQPPDRLLPPEQAGRPVRMEYLLVDTGLPEREVNRKVRVGDLISFAQPPLELGSTALAGHSLDNRASVAAVTYCLDELQHARHRWDVWAVATAQEEETLGGAATSSFSLRPDLAVVIDVTFAKGPGVNDQRGFPLDRGPTLGWGPNIHPGLHKTFKSLAEELDMPHHLEVSPSHTGTDAFAVQVALEGIPTMVVSIPLRYMHTPVELVALKDIRRTGRLLAEFINRLEPDYLDKLSAGGLKESEDKSA